MQRLGRFRSLKSTFWRSAQIPELKKRASNSLSAVQDTYYSTKDTFERHRVVFTVGTSIASIATALIGYTLRHFHETRVTTRLESLEAALKNNQQIERDEIKKIVHTGSFSTEACAATAMTTLIFGYAMGWRGGKWFANRKFRREQMKLLGQQMKPRRWKLHFLKKPNLQFIRTPINLIRDKSSNPLLKLQKHYRKDDHLPVVQTHAKQQRES